MWRNVAYTLFISVAIFVLSSYALAENQNKKFDYTTTVWIINSLDGSGIVYGRPKSDEYNEQQGFIYIYEILIKYVYKMQDINTASAIESLAVTHELILINSVTEQRILVGDHWISDETKIAVMQEADYKNLTAWLEERAKDNDKIINPPLEKLTQKLKEQTAQGTESFETYFKPHISKSASSHSKLDNTINDEAKNLSVYQKSSLSFQSSASKSSAVNKVTINSSGLDSSHLENLNSDGSTTKSLKHSSEVLQKLELPEATQSTYVYTLLVSIGILVALTICYFCLRKKSFGNK